MPILEFASVTLNAGVSPTNEGLLSVLRKSLDVVATANGVSGFRWVLTEGKGQQEPLLALVGIWASVEAHEEFSQRGLMLPLLASLKDYIRIGGIMHLGIPELSQNQSDVFTTVFVAASIRVDPSKHELVEIALGEVVKGHAGAETVVGWKVKKEESFDNAIKYGKEQFGQELHDEVVDEDILVVIAKEADKALVIHVVDKVEGLAIGAELFQWKTVLA